MIISWTIVPLLIFSLSIKCHGLFLHGNNITDELISLMQWLNLDQEKEYQQFQGPADELFCHGQFACVKGYPDKAIASLTEAERINPKKYLNSAQLVRSRIYLGRGFYGLAKQEFLKMYLSSQENKYNLEVLLGLRLASYLERKQLFQNGNSIFSESDNIILAQVDVDLCKSIKGLITHTGIKISPGITRSPDSDEICSLTHPSYQERVPVDEQTNNLVLFDESLEWSWMPNHLLSQQVSDDFSIQKYVVLKGMLQPPLLSLLQSWSYYLLKHNQLSYEPTLKRMTTASDRIGMLLDHQINLQSSRQFRPLIAHIIQGAGDSSTYCRSQSPPSAVADQVASNQTACDGDARALEIVPTYSFLSFYLVDGFIDPHVDRPQNEYSVTMNIKCPTGWPFSVHFDNGTEKKYYLSPGDAVLYRGGEVKHSRHKLVDLSGEEKKGLGATEKDSDGWGTRNCMQLIFGYRSVHSDHCNSQ